jgi:hypothetical protein
MARAGVVEVAMVAMVDMHRPVDMGMVNNKAADIKVDMEVVLKADMEVVLKADMEGLKVDMEALLKAVMEAGMVMEADMEVLLKADMEALKADMEFLKADMEFLKADMEVMEVPLKVDMEAHREGTVEEDIPNKEGIVHPDNKPSSK